MARMKQTIRKKPFQGYKRARYGSDDSLEKLSGSDKESEGEESPKPSSSKSTTQSTSCLDCAKIYKKVKELEKSVAAVHYYCETISKSVEKLASNSTEFASPATFSNKRPATKEDPVKAGLRQRIEVKRESQTWKDWVKKADLRLDDEVKEKLIKKELTDGPSDPSRLSLKIAKILWDWDYISQYLVGPEKRDARPGDRSKYLPSEENKKLERILKCASKNYLLDEEWKVCVKTPINQASRRITSWIGLKNEKIQSEKSGSVGRDKPGSPHGSASNLSNDPPSP